ncbi:hypothetical protein IMSAG049_00431 [Clostridiales bacterium]|nr:hypothetical protein IMSAG049_00431 [Clostridiales bacterium]
MDPKTTGIIKIIFWSVLALFLFNLLFKNLYGYTHIPRLSSSEHFGKNKVSENDFTDISEIEINWIDGEITVGIYDGDTINVSEYSKNPLSVKDMMQCKLSGDKLSIDYCSRKGFSFLFKPKNINKRLTVLIPKKLAQLNELKIDTVSSLIDISEICTKNINVETVSGPASISNVTLSDFSSSSVSGKIFAKSLTAQSINLDTVSGDCFIEGSVSLVDFDSTSGSLEFTSDICPSEIKAATISGNVTAYIPEDSSFSYSFDRVSGNFNTDFSVVLSKGGGTCGNADSEFSFDTVSGDVMLKAGRP